jgi:hypothetical protein
MFDVEMHLSGNTLSNLSSRPLPACLIVEKTTPFHVLQSG